MAKYIPLTYQGQDFEIGEAPVTFDEYDEFCDATGRTKPSDAGWGRGTRPVINVSYDDAKAFCAWLSERDPSYAYRLPTGEEWEFAARAGSTGAYCFGDDVEMLDEYAWTARNSNNQTHPVKEKKPNNFGLYDVHGNVWEWTD